MLVYTWFLKIAFGHEVSSYVCLCVCVMCVHPRQLITSGVIWTPYYRLNNLYNFYMAAIVSFVSSYRHGLTIEECHGNQPKKSKVKLYKLLHPL